MFDSPAFYPLHTATGSQLPFFHGSDHATLLDSLRIQLSPSDFRHLYAGAEPPSSAAGPDQAGRRGDLPVVAEERSDDEVCRASTTGRDVEDHDTSLPPGRAYSCDHCHCSVCKRSLEHHDCQQSLSDSSEHEVVSDDAGGSVKASLISIFTVLCVCLLCTFHV